MANKVRYVWTAQDALIAQGNTAGSVQGPYVTPFGIPPNQVPGCKDFAAGSEVEIDLDKAMAGEVWRSRRFHVDLALSYRWDDFEVPSSVTTLGELCKHLVATDPFQFPKSIYGEDKVKRPGPDNPAQMLFDYWENTKYRYAVVKSGFDWTTYSGSPGDLPVAKDGVKLAKVLVKNAIVKVVAVAPGPSKKGIDEPALDVDEYATRISALASNVRNLLETSARVMKERFQIIYRLQAIRAIGAASLTNPTDGALSAGAQIVATCDKLLPKFHALLVAQPIRTGSTEQRLLEVFSEKKEFTNDLVADLAAARHKLRNLLLESETQRAALEKWAKSIQPGFVEARPDVTALVDKVTAAMAEGHLALGECGPQGADDDTLLAILDAMPEKHALGPDDVKGDSPTAVLASLVGKGVSIGQTAVGNLAGPPSLSIAMTQVYATWKFAKLAKESLAVLAAVPAGTSVTIETVTWMKLADRLTDQLPKGQVRDDVHLALLSEDRKALIALKDKFGAEMAGSKQQTVPWKGAMVILSLITSILAINDAAASNKKSFPMFAIDFTSMTAGGVQVALGTYEAYMTSAGRLADVAEALGKAGNVVGAVTSVIGLVQGVAGYAEAYEKADGFGLVINSLGIAGSLGMAVVAGVAAFSGPAMPVVAAVSLACLLLSGAVSLAQVVESLEPGALKTNTLCYGLVRAIRKDTLGQFLEQSDAAILYGMEDLEKAAKSGRVPYANNTLFTVLALAKAGLSEDMIKDVVNSSALANTYFGPGLAPGVPAQP
jgi:outer membrane murein-binding lipoprotein Lpp